MSDLQPEAFDAAGLVRRRPSHMRYLWLVGVAVYLGAIWYVGCRRIADTLAGIDVPILVAMMAVETFGLWMRALKWRLVLGPGQTATRLFFMSKAAGGVSPGRVGELAPLLLREHRTPRMAAWIVVDRLLEIAATLGLGLVGLVALREHPRGMVAVTLIALSVLVIAPLFVLTRRGLFLWIAGRLRDGSVVHRVCLLLAAMSDEVRALGPRIPLASALTIAASCIDICVGILLYRSFGATAGFFLIAVVQCAHGIASAVPFTPNATGVPYVIAAGLLYTLGGIPKEVLAAAVGVRMAAVGIVFWTSFGLVFARKKKPAEPQGQAALFDRLASGSQLYEYQPETLERIRRLVPSGGCLLDVGCGDGAIPAALDAQRIVGLDLSLGCARLAHARGFPVVVGDAAAGMPFASDSFDTVCCFDVLHHLGRSWGGIVAEVHRVLRPGGTCIVIEPDANNPLIRWTQAPDSLIRTAPFDDEPAIYVAELLPHFLTRGFTCEQRPIHIEGKQIERAIFPLWQRLLKAPAVLILAWWFRRRPNKFAIIAHKKEDRP